MIRTYLRMSPFCCFATALVIGALAATPASATITLGQADDFEDGTTQSWEEGGPSPNPPTNVANGGPAGAGDNYLSATSSGGGGAGSRQVVYNRDQWTGDYLTAGVDKVTAMMANFGSSDVTMRLGFERNFGERYATTAGAVIPADGQWHAVSFDVAPSDLTNVGGAASAIDVMSAVGEIRILAASAGPTWFGDAIVSSVGVDNLTALPEPGSIALLALGSLAVMNRRRA